MENLSISYSIAHLFVQPQEKFVENPNLPRGSLIDVLDKLNPDTLNSANELIENIEELSNPEQVNKEQCQNTLTYLNAGIAAPFMYGTGFWTSDGAIFNFEKGHPTLYLTKGHLNPFINLYKLDRVRFSKIVPRTRLRDNSSKFCSWKEISTMNFFTGSGFKPNPSFKFETLPVDSEYIGTLESKIEQGDVCKIYLNNVGLNDKGEFSFDIKKENEFNKEQKKIISWIYGKDLSKLREYAIKYKKDANLFPKIRIAQQSILENEFNLKGSFASLTAFNTYNPGGMWLFMKENAEMYFMSGRGISKK